MLPSRLVAGMITLYQRTLSPDHGPLRHLFRYGYCPHEPTCSEFTRLAVLRDGVVIGGMKGMRRLLSCHPWTKPGDAKLRKLAERELRR